MKKKLFKFNWNCGRMGNVDGLFIAEEGELNNAIGKEVYFGEILGKHSEIYGSLDQEDIETINISDDAVMELAKYLEHSSISGYNPLEYLREGEGE